MAQERTHNRNVRPNSPRLPVVDFRHDTEDCPDCGGWGTIEVDCPACCGDFQVDGDPCTECNAEGTVDADCPTCEGTGRVGGDDVG